MKSKYLLIIPILSGIMATSCESFFDLSPKDRLTSESFWNDADDAYAALTACYNWWYANDQGGVSLFYEDAYSDIAFNFTNAGNMRDVAKGSLSASAAPNKWKQYESIRRCNFVIENIDRVPEDKITAEQKGDILGQARAIRGYSHALISNWYGDAVLMDYVPDTDTDAKVPRVDAAIVRQHALDDLEWAADHINEKPAEKGRIAKGAVLAMLVRFNLYWGNWQAVIDNAEKLKALNQYELDPNFLEMFSMAGQNSKEIIATYEQVAVVYKFNYAIRLFNNADGGWATTVPTDNLVNMFEMKDGKLITDEDSGYDPVHPYANRDPRLKQTVLYSGLEWNGKNNVTRILNTIDKTIDGKANADYYNAADNASKTGYIFAKYAWPGPGQYSESLRDDSLCPIVFRYGEVLISEAEAYAELNELSKALDIVDKIRITRGHIAVDRSRYNTQAKVRELVRRERTIELAGEGFRYEDIIRWDEYDENGNKTGRKVAQTVLPGDLLRSCGTVDMSEPDPDKRAVINPNASREDRLIETRGEFDVPRRLLFPLLQAELDANPYLVQNPGY